MTKLTTEEIDKLAVIIVNELDPVLFTDVNDLIKSNLDVKEKLLYLNRLINFKEMNDNTLNELFTIFQKIDKLSYITKINANTAKFEVQGIEGLITKKGIGINE